MQCMPDNKKHRVPKSEAIEMVNGNMIGNSGATQTFPMKNICGSSSRVEGATCTTATANKGALQPPAITYLGHNKLLVLSALPREKKTGLERGVQWYKPCSKLNHLPPTIGKDKVRVNNVEGFGKGYQLGLSRCRYSDLQDVCMAIESLTTLDLPMVVDSIGIYELKGPYYTLTKTDWFLQALSVIPRGSWGDVARRFTMIPWVDQKNVFSDSQ
ncbi:hypothetical protein F511_31649 [Dorcoceras hygrometricum]|uniref:Uncharacterized protein n=1 Tax=Dorcoceras hygrometricum TaxID=472368 RepID=A0A2Z7D411_9LAMI|nr:hypothetical protein F511_31649 [Dorcoceras hygrometricum]